MSKIVQIFFIYADNCDHCKEALETIERSISIVKNATCQISKFHYDTNVAISIAVNKGITELPGFVIGDDVYMGDDYTEKEIIESIKKANNG
jgi:glutaredoxin